MSITPPGSSGVRHSTAVSSGPTRVEEGVERSFSKFGARRGDDEKIQELLFALSSSHQ